jgi:protein PhnA
MSDSIKCPQCSSPYGYPTGTSMMCPECGHEWNPVTTASDEAAETETDSAVVKDANGNVLQDGDTVVIIKDLPVKGAPKPMKAGTKVKNIKLTSGDHNIDCKVEGFGAMGLKSIYVRKA